MHPQGRISVHAAVLMPYLEEAAYEHFGAGGASAVRLELEGDQIVVRAA